MRIEIWSDVVCPWCWIGKRRFERALAEFPHRNDVEVVWKSFELDPSAPRERDGDLAGHLADKYGVARPDAVNMIARMTETAAAEGLAFRLDVARPGNTFDAHRLLHFAAENGHQHELKERLFSAYLSEGEAIGDIETLVRMAKDVGLDVAEARAVLDSDRYADAVRADEAEAAAIGVTGVPFFVVDRRYGISGAQPADLLRQVLHRAWAESAPLTLVGNGGSAGCEGHSCAR